MKSFKKISHRNESHSTTKTSNLESTTDHNKSTKIKKKLGKTLKCIIRLLDDSQKPLEFSVSKEDLGQTVFSFVCHTIGDLTEYDYFGLRYRDKYDQEQWLDLSSSVYKQIRRSKLPELCFRLKHYPSDPIKDLKQNITRYLVYLQIRRDFAHGRLVCPQSLVGSLGALIVQAELGDAPLADEPEKICYSENADFPHDTESNPSDNVTAESTTDNTTKNYLKDFPIFHSQTPENELEIIEKHQQLRGLTAQEVESELLNRVAHLPTYGIVPFPVTPQHKIETTGTELDGSTGHIDKQNSLGRKHNLGISGNGLVTFIGIKKVQEFPWNEIQRLGCDGKQFIVCLKKQESSLLKRMLRGKNRVFTYECESPAAALALWRWAVDRKCFFTLAEAKQAKRLRPNSSLFHRNQTYRFSGRSYQELRTIPADSKQPQFVRVSSMRNSTRPELFQSKHATLPGRLRHSGSEQEEPKDYADPFNRKSVPPNETSTAVLVPSTVIEQPMEEAPFDIGYANKEDQIINKVTPVLTADSKQTVGEIRIESNVVQPSSAMPTVPTLHTGQTAMEIRDRVDSKLVHSVVYEQVISALDQAIDAHDDSTSDSREIKPAVLLNGEIQRNGTCGEMTNGSSGKRLQKPLGNKDNAQPENSEGNLVKNTDDWGKHKVSLNRTKLAAVAISVFVLVGLAVIIESTPTADFPVAKYLRSNTLIAGFENHVYSPVKKLILSGLSQIWS